jgi:16S rRNA (adenine1518-N6/adenine1519-N6)-dimethyltransferase
MATAPDYKNEKEFTPRKYLGQNFLADDAFARRMVDEITVPDGEAILEIGPGFGALTRHLLNKNVMVCAVEYDRRLYNYLKDYFRNYSNFVLYHHDILSFDLAELRKHVPGNSRFVLVSNLPYTISHHVMYWLMQHYQWFNGVFLTLQKEVAAKLVALPSSKEYGPLTIAMGCFYTVRKLMHLAPRLFLPQPAVDSTYIKLTNEESVKTLLQNKPLFFDLLRLSFAQRRKMMKNNLVAAKTKYLALEQADMDRLAGLARIDLSRRAETLTKEEFIRLANTLNEFRS